jgi:hypothetical protein
MIARQRAGRESQPDRTTEKRSALCDEHGQLEQIIYTGVDITDRVQAEKCLRENECRLDHLAHHDTLREHGC